MKGSLMAQSSITTKYTITATTGTAGATFLPQGRDQNQVLWWRTSANSPLSAHALSITGRYVQDGGVDRTGKWLSRVTLNAPVMQNVTGETSDGYAALPEVAGRTIFTLNTNRTGLMSDAEAALALDELAYSLLTDAALRANVIGFKPADV